MSALWLASLWPWALALVAAYCLAQIIRDCRARHYLWAVAGVICLAALLITPIQSRVLKLDLPARVEDANFVAP
jgi:hypothetical protein